MKAQETQQWCKDSRGAMQPETGKSPSGVHITGSPTSTERSSVEQKDAQHEVREFKKKRSESAFATGQPNSGCFLWNGQVWDERSNMILHTE